MAPFEEVNDRRSPEDTQPIAPIQRKRAMDDWFRVVIASGVVFGLLVIGIGVIL